MKKSNPVDSVLVRLSIPSRLAVERIKAAGFADDDVAAIRVAIADMAIRLGPPQARTLRLAPIGRPNAPAKDARQSEPGDSLAAAKEALRMARSEQCVCRVATGRHHVLVSLLEPLSRGRTTNWLEVLDHARESAAKYNQRLGLPLSQPPASVAYNPAAMSQNWMRAYIDGGAGKFKERYSPDGPGVATTASPTGRGIRIELA